MYFPAFFTSLLPPSIRYALLSGVRIKMQSPCPTSSMVTCTPENKFWGIVRTAVAVTIPIPNTAAHLLFLSLFLSALPAFFLPTLITFPLNFFCLSGFSLQPFTTVFPILSSFISSVFFLFFIHSNTPPTIR